jgi:hypothetical protein
VVARDALLPMPGDVADRRARRQPDLPALGDGRQVRAGAIRADAGNGWVEGILRKNRDTPLLLGISAR